MKLAGIALIAAYFWAAIAGLLFLAAGITWLAHQGRHSTPLHLLEYGAKFTLLAVICWGVRRALR